MAATDTAFLVKTRAYAQKLATWSKKAQYTVPESALAIIQDADYQQAIRTALQPFKAVRRVVLVGIGGSSLGTEAVYNALKTPKSPALTVLDSIERDAFDALESDLQALGAPEELALVIVSKSGDTIETMLNASLALEIAKKRFGAGVLDRVICIGNDGTPFLENAQKQHLRTFSIPTAIGGRYSVFTAAGMVPLTLLGIDTRALLSGAQSALTPAHLRASAEQAAALAWHAESGANIVNFFTFNDRLETLGYWYRQLLAESIGKTTDAEGKPFRHSLLPTVSTAQDLHSVAQLYLSGYHGIFTQFLYADEKPSLRVPTHWLTEGVHLHGKTHTAVRCALRDGVLAAYKEQNLPHTYRELQKIDAHTIGELMAGFMVEVMCYAHAFNINAFDQPNVELYKAHARTALAK